MTRWIRILGLGCATSLCACNGGQAPQPVKTASRDQARAAAEHDGEPAPFQAGPVRIFVDDALVMTVPPERLRDAPRLSALLPDGPPLKAWTLLASKADGHRRQAISNPDERFPELEPGLFVHPRTGTGAIGLFPRDAGEDAVPEKALDGVFEVRISTAPPIDPEAAKKLTLIVASTVIELDPEQLERLPTSASPELDKGTQRGGWDLPAVLAPHTDLARVGLVRIVDVQGDVIEVPGDALRSETDTLWLKRNRMGMYRFKWFHTEAGATEPTEKGNARGVVRIDVALAAGPDAGADGVPAPAKLPVD